MNELGDYYKNIVGKSTAGTTVKTGQGGLMNLVINKAAAAGLITLWDSLTASGNKIGTITMASTLVNGSRTYAARFATGLTIQTNSSLVDLTVTYR